MNERIFELINQAGIECTVDPTEGPFYDCFEDQLEKFVNLIVSDCIEIVEPCKCGCCNGEPESIITETIINQIKQHFGIK